MKPIERPKSLTEVAVVRLREAIVSGDFELGQPLSERQLAEMLDISKTPVREALAQLRLEGLVRILPQKGAFVFTLSAQEVVEICELRLALESAALKFSIERNRKEFADALSESAKRMMIYRTGNDNKSYLKEDTSFHNLFFEYCGNSLIKQAYAIHSGKISAIRTHLAHMSSLQMDLSFSEHERLAELARAGHIDEALAVLDAHISRNVSSYPNGE